MPTQVTGSYADIHTFDNLYCAYRKAAKGKRGRSSAAAFEFRLEDELILLQDELAAGTYQPGQYVHFIMTLLYPNGDNRCASSCSHITRRICSGVTVSGLSPRIVSKRSV